MNRLRATITAIEEEERLHIITFDASGIPLRMMGLELPPGIHVGSQVWLGCKPSHVIIAKDLSGEISLSNRIPATITKIQAGKLLCALLLQSPCGNFESLITQNSADRMELQEGEQVLALIKASELSIIEVG